MSRKPEDSAAPARSERVPSIFRQALSIPNQLTLFRLLVLPFTLISMMYRQHDMAFWLFLAAAVTDGFDGLIARRFNQKTALGAFLDPIVDKLFLSSAFFVQALIGAIPWWLTILVLSRDVIIVTTVLVVVLTTGLRDFPPSLLGKVNTMVLFSAMLFVLLNNYQAAAWTGVLVEGLTWVAAATILLSSFHYAVETSRRLRDEVAD